MRRVTRVETYDGKIHITAERAKRHLDALYADVLCRLAHKLVQAEKYTKICEVLEESGDAFKALLEIKADLALVPESEEN